MARVRRKARATMRLNLEIAGIAAFGAALYLGLAIGAPDHSGALGERLARWLTLAFGAAAWLVPLVVALLGGIVFLEINVPRLIAKFGSASLLYFLVFDAFWDRSGGAVGYGVARLLRALLGASGERVALVVIALGVTVWIFNVSVKRIIGWCIANAHRLRALWARLKVKPPAGADAKSGPQSLREAFELPERTGASRKAAGTALVPVRKEPVVREAPIVREEVIARDEPVAPAEPEELEDEELDDEDDEEFEDDDDVEDEDEGEDEAVSATEHRPGLVVGEYQAAVVSYVSSPEGGRRPYRLPDLALFDPPQAQIVDESQRSSILEDTLASFGVGAKVTHIERGPAVTRYELRPERGVKISRISSLADDIALALAATSVRIEAPIPGKSAVGIEVPNAHVSTVTISEILQALPSRGQIPPLNVALGKDITGRPVFGDLGKMPHLLVAGATGAGKSVCLNAMIASLLVSATPDQLQLLMIDPKRVELSVYNGIPHLIKEVITDPRLAAGALFEMTKEMDSRYERFAKAGVRKIEEYNAKYPDEKLPYVVIFIDELADLMMIAPGKVEITICRIAQLARATGIHLVVATQRPSVDVITGIIKANIPSRLSFAVSSQVDSRTILDMVGAERLLGRGDMLYLPIDAPKPIRAQGALITGGEITRLVAFWAAQSRPDNLLDVELMPIEDDEKARAVDPLAYDAARFIIETNYASTAQLQSQFSIGHPRAVRLMKQLEDFGVVGPHEGTKPRRINVSLGELERIASRFGRDGQTDLFAQGA
jgi:S-DNA-T family DNA segregation ATPase FtsK/SpoIIIE